MVASQENATTAALHYLKHPGDGDGRGDRQEACRRTAS